MPSTESMDVDLQSRPSPAPRTRLQTDPVTGEPVLLYPEGLLRLNATAHAILLRCDGQRTVEDIVADLGREYEASADDLRADVVECLALLHGKQLVVFAV